MPSFSNFLDDFAEKWTPMKTNQHVVETPQLHQIPPVPTDSIG